MTRTRTLAIALTCMLGSCMAQTQPPPQAAYYPQPSQPSQPPAAASYGDDETYGDGMAPVAGQPQPAAVAGRRITINGVAATRDDLATLDAIERQWGNRLPDGDYWYDAVSGAAGYWGGPMIGTLPANLRLGGPLPASASGGGNGRLSGVFINGREIHPQDVVQLQALVGEVPQGRWWVDGEGNFGAEGGAMMGNLYALSQQQHPGRSGRSESSTSRAGSVYTRGGCVRVTGRDGSTMSTGC